LSPSTLHAKSKQIRGFLGISHSTPTGRSP
jgi:hypothetical protein